MGTVWFDTRNSSHTDLERVSRIDKCEKYLATEIFERSKRERAADKAAKKQHGVSPEAV
jgi:hypothetical protein